jgi:hypothetical protein
MAIRYDISLTNNDLYFKNGDLEIAESDMQHIIDTMAAFPGWWKEYPLDGVGVMAYSKGAANTQEINRKIGIELRSDGYNPRNASVNLSPSGELIINPNVEPL